MKFYALIIATLSALALVVAPTVASAAPSTQKCQDPVQERISGTFLDTSGVLQSYSACVTLQNVNSSGEAVLRVVGTVTNTVSGTTSTFRATETAPLQINQASCQILDLTIGPIDLDLLGLIVETNEIHLEIRAEQGPGNLLGNLLCALTGILDPNGSLTDQVIGLLNQIIDILSNL